jgi:hypothetical protein
MICHIRRDRTTISDHNKTNQGREKKSAKNFIKIKNKIKLRIIMLDPA